VAMPPPEQGLLGGYNGDLRAASSGKAAEVVLLPKTSVRWRCQTVESSTESRDTGGGIHRVQLTSTRNTCGPSRPGYVKYKSVNCGDIT
jgi:hypothetical protein